MSEFKKAELFNQSVDEIMEGKTPSKPGDSVDQQLYQLAAMLKGSDFSQDNIAQARMRHSLLNLCRERDFRNYEKENIMKKLFEHHRTVTVFGSLALIFMLTLTLVFPGTVTAVADNVGDNIAKILKLGKYSAVVQVKDSDPAAKKELTEEQKEQMRKEGSIIIKTENGEVKVSNPDYAKKQKDENIVNYASIKEAQKIAAFKIQAPSYLPAGYELKDVEGYKGSGDYINLYFKGNGKDIILFERIMSENTQFTYATSGEVQEVQVNGATAAWEPGVGLMWEKDGVSFDLICKGFNQDEAIKMANSFK